MTDYAPLTVPCPTCHAPAGSPCTRLDGTPSEVTHRTRDGRAEVRAIAAQALGPDPATT